MEINIKGLREELSNPAIGSREVLRAIALHLLDELESAKKRIAELRDWNLGLAQESFTHQQRIAELEALAKSVKFYPIPMEELGNKSDGKKHPYMFGAGYNSAVVHCESVMLKAFAAAGIGKGE